MQNALPQSTSLELPEDNLLVGDETYRDLLDNISDLIQSVAPDGSFIYVNRAWQEALGYRTEELAGLSMFDIIHPDSKAHCLEMFQRVLAGETLRRVEAKFITRPGQIIIVEGANNCRFVEGKPVATRSIFRDITERKKAEEEREKLIAQLQESLAKVQLLGGLLPICSSCKNIRDDKGYWNKIDVYVSKHSEAEFTHSLCPICTKRLYPQIYTELFPDEA